ncbi:MAG: twin-arginine translocation signal domain-containing protein, partial [Candidatus Thiodiazotropha sp.]
MKLNRRDFIKSSVATGGLIATSAMAPEAMA